ncbi:ABC-ATPase domain-containing protein [Thermoleophilum album]|uniref:Predicted ATPase of the ABC class n=1 Tax=Thermoleophilum album TaxID=29539 RepID=A0A1H6FWM3_THEAL|nr:ABC-ATPase domain-containing protein [Thermoleophilum album]SEH14568.1 Predicted ATPase of the ABC class [Thermoleophilum album]
MASASPEQPLARAGASGDLVQLARLLERLDGSSYGSYRRLRGNWSFDGGVLAIDRVQPDPFAPPSRARLVLDARWTGLPREFTCTADRRRALADLIARQGRSRAPREVRIDAGGQRIIERSSCEVADDGAVTLRFGLELPGRGRRIDGRNAERLICRDLPALARALRYGELGRERIALHAATVEDAQALRAMLPAHRWIAFLADDSLLPRRSGVDERPARAAVPLRAPASLASVVELPNRGRVRGLALREGTTLLVGGGYHGKSTLLRALADGVYDHLPGDGRELCVTRSDAVHVRAEDGRAVTRVDIGAFIGELPTGTTGRDFSTQAASGSTSQAASICEALEAGSRLLLIDEDTSATNLLIRDARMQALVPKRDEPITPLIDLLTPLEREHGVSIVLVSGGVGDYLGVANTVVLMRRFVPEEVTEQAHRIAASLPARRSEAERFGAIRERLPQLAIARRRGAEFPRLRAPSVRELRLGDELVDLSAVEQLAERSQTLAIGVAIAQLERSGALDGSTSLRLLLDRCEQAFEDRALHRWAERLGVDLARPRRYELAAALNRIRSLRVVGFS